MRRSATVIALVLVLAVAPGRAATSTFVEAHPGVADALRLLDLWIEEQREYIGFPGLSIGIVHDQELIWSKGYGYADLESEQPATPTTFYRLGSVTKTFTATAIMMLRDAGKLRLDDPVVRHLPWFEVDSDFPDAPQITIRHLLTHTSGLPREAAFPYWTDHDFPTSAEIREALPRQKAIYPPATTYKYSNLGMALLGEIVAAVSGIPYADFLDERIFRPLGMTSSRVTPTTAIEPLMATAYMRRMPDGGRATHAYYDTRGMAPAADVVSTVEDLARFAALHLQDGPAEGAQILRGSTLREMQRPHWVYSSWSGGRGLAFAITDRKGKTVVTHGGWIGGHRSHLLLAPREKIAVVAMTNADDQAPYLFSYAAYDLVAPAILAAVAAAPQEKAPRDPEWQRYLGVYADPWGWEYEVLILDDELVMYGHDYPPDEDPREGLTGLAPVGEHTFRMGDGELVVFELDDDGEVERIKRRYDFIYPTER